MIDHAARRPPIKGTVAVTGGDETSTCVKHLILRTPRAKLRADGIPGRLQQLDLVLGIEVRRSLRLAQDRCELGIGPVAEGRRQHDQRAPGEIANEIYQTRIEVL